ncbi:MAG TPA: thioredoxin domain-containing protein [Syntrophales bacterium]|nr:thioredoxin domain-containing protein [Syntrophales bacterium]
MKKNLFCLLPMFLFLAMVGAGAAGEPPKTVPVKGMVTMVDLGATRCIPCKMMAPILQRVEKRYAGKAAIVFLDVWVDPQPARRFGIRAIPTQIFFNKKGEEVYRHEGFMSEEAIVAVLQKMGVK